MTPDFRSHSMNKLIKKFLSKLDSRDITREDGEPYLTRYYIFKKPVSWMPSIYIHCFHNSDHDYAVHSHPWNYSISFIFSGSYAEERRQKDDSIKTKILSPGRINFIRGTDFHRVDLLSPNVWTLFISGPKVKDWGFWDRDTHEYTQWEKFLEMKKELISHAAE